MKLPLAAALMVGTVMLAQSAQSSAPATVRDFHQIDKARPKSDPVPVGLIPVL